MQERHFWYRGRHRFFLEAVNRYLPKSGQQFSAIYLGGGSGWVRYLVQPRSAFASAGDRIFEDHAATDENKAAAVSSHPTGW